MYRKARGGEGNRGERRDQGRDETTPWPLLTFPITGNH
jgi:hypothetical protein